MTGDVVFNGGGHVTLTDSANNSIVGDGAAATPTNFDAIAGAGTIGDSHLALLNSGIINANGSHPLIIDTGVIPARLTGPWAASWLQTMPAASWKSRQATRCRSMTMS
jgi:hypothetical protein